MNELIGEGETIAKPINQIRIEFQIYSNINVIIC